MLSQSFQQEISLTTAKIEHIFHQGDTLIEKSEPLDAAVIEEELEELQRYCQEVFGRVERYYKKLIRLPVRYEWILHMNCRSLSPTSVVKTFVTSVWFLKCDIIRRSLIIYFNHVDVNGLFLQLADEDTEVSFSDRESELDEPGDLSGVPWNERLGDGFLSPLPSSGRSASLAAQLRTERSGRDTPASVDSIPLEWDHDYDLSRGLESASRALREQQSEEGDFLQRPSSSLSG